MTGTIVNVAAVLAGGGIGLALKRGLSEPMEKSVTQVLGLTTCIIGLNGVLGAMLTVEGGKIKSGGEILLLCSLALGVVFGQWLRLEERLEQVGDAIERKIGVGSFSKGFVSASILFCVGAMTIMGSLSDGLSGDSRILFTKSALDFIAAMVLASALGVGVLFSAVTVLLYQGGLTLGAGLLAGVLVDPLLSQICMVGYAIVICIGINFFGCIKIKTANLLPALLVPPMYNLLMLLKTLW